MNILNNKKLFFCATEQSGDNIGILILNKLRYDYPSLIFEGVGGSKMKKLMKKQFYTIKDFNSMGIIEILSSLKKYIVMINHLTDIIIKNNYEAVITIDSPDFNYPLSKKIRSKGYKGKIIQVVAPTVWAWRKNRAKKFAKIYDKILTLFPFENQYFERFNLTSVCIGHPIFYINDNSNYNKIKTYIAFLPGSRLKEVSSLITYFKLVSEYLESISSPLKIFIATLPHLKNDIEKFISDWKIKPKIIIDSNELEKFYSKTYIALVCSGTATLEITKRNIPQLIIYKLNYLTEIIVSFFIKVKFANIINIMSNQMIIPEITNSRLNKYIIIEQFKKLLQNHDNIHEKQLKNSRKYLSRIILSKSPDTIAADEIKKLFF